MPSPTEIRPPATAEAAPAAQATARSGRRAHILVVDDDDAVCRMITLALEIAGHEVTSVCQARQALALLETNHFDLVITDLVMPDVEGIEIIMRVSQAHTPVPVVAISGEGADGPEEYLGIARLLGATCTLPKPFDCRRLLQVVEDALAAGR